MPKTSWILTASTGDSKGPFLSAYRIGMADPDGTRIWVGACWSTIFNCSQVKRAFTAASRSTRFSPAAEVTPERKGPSQSARASVSALSPTSGNRAKSSPAPATPFRKMTLYLKSIVFFGQSNFPSPLSLMPRSTAAFTASGSGVGKGVWLVITSYSIHYTKLYDFPQASE